MESKRELLQVGLGVMEEITTASSLGGQSGDLVDCYYLVSWEFMDR